MDATIAYPLRFINKNKCYFSTIHSEVLSSANASDGPKHQREATRRSMLWFGGGVIMGSCATGARAGEVIE